MKNTITRLVLAVTLMLFGRTSVRYTQQQVMGRYKTRQDITRKFGLIPPKNEFTAIRV